MIVHAKELITMTQKDNSEEKSGSCDTLSESEIDESLAETFPASDPPPWTLGIEPHCHPEDNESKNQPAKKSPPNDDF